jgi:hypothetical protein
MVYFSKFKEKVKLKKHSNGIECGGAGTIKPQIEALESAFSSKITFAANQIIGDLEKPGSKLKGLFVSGMDLRDFFVGLVIINPDEVTALFEIFNSYNAGEKIDATPLMNILKAAKHEYEKLGVEDREIIDTGYVYQVEKKLSQQFKIDRANLFIDTNRNRIIKLDNQGISVDAVYKALFMDYYTTINPNCVELSTLLDLICKFDSIIGSETILKKRSGFEVMEVIDLSLCVGNIENIAEINYELSLALNAAEGSNQIVDIQELEKCYFLACLRLYDSIRLDIWKNLKPIKSNDSARYAQVFGYSISKIHQEYRGLLVVNTKFIIAMVEKGLEDLNAQDRIEKEKYKGILKKSMEARDKDLILVEREVKGTVIGLVEEKYRQSYNEAGIRIIVDKLIECFEGKISIANCRILEEGKWRKIRQFIETAIIFPNKELLAEYELVIEASTQHSNLMVGLRTGNSTNIQKTVSSEKNHLTTKNNTTLKEFFTLSFPLAVNRFGTNKVFDLFFVYDEYDREKLAGNLEGLTNAQKLNLKLKIENKIPELAEMNATPKTIGEILGEISVNDFLEMAIEFEENEAVYRSDQPENHYAFGLYCLIFNYVKELKQSGAVTVYKYDQFLADSFDALSEGERALLTKKAEEIGLTQVVEIPHTYRQIQGDLVVGETRDTIARADGVKDNGKKLGIEKLEKSTDYVKTIYELILGLKRSYVEVDIFDGSEKIGKILFVDGLAVRVKEGGAVYFFRNDKMSANQLENLLIGKSTAVKKQGNLVEMMDSVTPKTPTKFNEFCLTHGLRLATLSHDLNGQWRAKAEDYIKNPKGQKWPIGLSSDYDVATITEINGLFDARITTALFNQFSNYDKVKNFTWDNLPTDPNDIISLALELKSISRSQTDGSEGKKIEASGSVLEALQNTPELRQNEFFKGYIMSVFEVFEFIHTGVTALEKKIKESDDPSIYRAISQILSGLKSSYNNRGNYKNERFLVTHVLGNNLLETEIKNRFDFIKKIS